MLDRAGILRRIPHAGASCLLERVTFWSDTAIRCTTDAHLDPDNPLRRDGRLDMTCGVEIAMQAAALHGGLRDGDAPPRIGHLVGLRQVRLAPGRLDDPRYGTLSVLADLHHADGDGMSYLFRLLAEDGRELLAGHGLVALKGAIADTGGTGP